MLQHASPTPEQIALFQKRSRAILITLLFPTMAIILNGSMFGVALPTIRDELGISADVAAWLTIAFSMPFMMFMPLYGRMGDDLGRPRLLIVGTIVFALGSLLALISTNLALLFVGRVIQGAGSAGITPLSLAIIARRFSEEDRGRALGTWNSVAPGTSIFAPSVGGLLVDSLGWHTIFIPAIVVAVAAAVIVRWQIPTLRHSVNWSDLRGFDWAAVPLLSGTIVFLVLFVSSRPVTGIEPLRDWRLLLGSLLFGFVFVLWERRHPVPLVDLRLFRESDFRLASLLGGARMIMMIGIGFLMPLYLTDVYDLTASTIGLLATAHSTALFIFIRLGGTLADRRSNRWLVAISISIQLSVMTYFAVLPAGRSLLWIVLGIAIHGSGGGLALAALHRTALGGVPAEHTGSAAGIYSMTRFAGSMLATAVAGVILQRGLDSGLQQVDAYQAVFGALAAAGVFGVVLASRLRN